MPNDILIILVVSPLLLIESREIWQGLWSLPLVTSFGLVALGVDFTFAFSTVVMVQIYYFSRTPSGASRFPEFCYAFWLLGGLTLIFSGSVTEFPIFSSILIFLAITGLAYVAAYVLHLKRKVLEKITGLGDSSHQMNFPIQMTLSVVLSYLLFALPAWILYFTVELLKEYISGLITMATYSYLRIGLVCFTVIFMLFRLRLKNLDLVHALFFLAGLLISGFYKLFAN